ncbi:MAG TPA: hypothetical protein PLI53_10755 [Geobacteraceae bacterium]|nr:hypothetical protein [Geobacteraceae bacterium]
MKLIGRLEKKLGRFAIPNITVYLIAGQTLFYVLFMMGKLDRDLVWLSADRLIAGEWWRLVTFPLDPPLQNPIFAFFAWYLFYLMGSALEELWGAFRYNLFLLAGYCLTVAASFVTPVFPVSNAFLGGSVFLAFAFLFPDFQLLLFFVLPVRIKWLALITWLGYGYLFLVGGLTARMMVLASVGNFLLFFARDIFINVRYGKRKVARKMAVSVSRDDGVYHRCTVCGITNKSHPDMDFRYCPDCDGQYCYCTEHIFNHEHVKKKDRQ